MAGEAYPTEPLYRYPWTNLSEAALRQAVDGVAAAGPEPQRASADLSLAGQTLQIATDGGPSLSYRFLTGNRLMLTEPGNDPVQAGYGAATVDHVTFFAHLIPGTMRGYAVMFDHDSGLATVVDLWFGREPRSREVHRHITHGYVAKDGVAAPEARHEPTARVEGRGLFWTDDRGQETLEFYASTIYANVVDRTRLDGKFGYAFPAEYIQLTEDLYFIMRMEAEFSGIATLMLVDMNRLHAAGLRLGFDGADKLEYYMFESNAEWLGQIARFEEFGDVSGNPIKPPSEEKGARVIYRPFGTWDKMTRAEVDAVASNDDHVFARASAMAGHGNPPTGKLAGRELTIRYDNGPRLEYRFDSADSLRWRKDGGAWKTTRYNAWESAPGVFLFGHLLVGEPQHDGHIVTMDLDAGLATAFRGYLNTPHVANEAWSETMFGVVQGSGIPDPGPKRHEFTHDMLGRCMTWSYSPGLTSMHLYSTPNTVSWIIFTPTGHAGTQWAGPGEFVKIRDGLYFLYWREDACNGTLGCILVNMRTMHDAGIGYHCGKEGLSLGPVGAYARHAGRFDIERFFDGKEKA